MKEEYKRDGRSTGKRRMKNEYKGREEYRKRGRTKKRK